MHIYIPYILNKYTERDVINIFNNADIGEVEHIEFHKLKYHSYYKSVIVNIHNIHKSEFGKQICNDVVVNNTPFKFYPELRNRDMYWLLMKHDNNKLSKNKYELLKDTIAEQEKEIQRLSDIIVKQGITLLCNNIVME